MSLNVDKHQHFHTDVINNNIFSYVLNVVCIFIFLQSVFSHTGIKLAQPLWNITLILDLHCLK